MADYNELLPTEIRTIDRLKNLFRRLTGYRDGRRFLIDSDPIMRNYSEIELMNLANAEDKLKSSLKENKEVGKTVNGISENEAEALLQYVVQNTREEFQKTLDDTPIEERTLGGYCGLGQGITAYNFTNMGLSPYVCNANPMFGKNCGRHGFVAVSIPIKKGKKVFEKPYLVDTTYRQFFERDSRYGIATEDQKENYIIKDKRFGNRVYPNEGYWAIKVKGGEEFSKELLTKGFIELTEKNAKIYGDSFVLNVQSREDYTKVPKGKELVTDNSGKYYIEQITNPSLQQELDYDLEELESCTKTPLMRKNERIKDMNVPEVAVEKDEVGKDVSAPKDKTERETDEMR